MSARGRERRTMVQSFMWWCEDNVCDCTEPIIRRAFPNPRSDIGYDFQTIWVGAFHSEASYEEHKEQERELREATAALLMLARWYEVGVSKRLEADR